MIPRPEPKQLPATAPWLLHSLRNVFDARHQSLRQAAQAACSAPGEQPVEVKFIHRCMEVTALYDRACGRFVELRACDVGERDKPSYCIVMKLQQDEDRSRVL